jgi:hypothetical protein
MTEAHLEEVCCPTGLVGLVKPMTVGDISALTESQQNHPKAKGKSKDPLTRLYRSVWMRTLDVGIYTAEQAVVVDQEITQWERISLADRQALLLDLRAISYGDEFHFRTRCRTCKSPIDWMVNLSELERLGLSKEMQEVVERDGVDGFLQMTMPGSGTVIGMKILTGADQTNVESMRAKGQGAMTEAAILSRLPYISGAKSPSERRSFVRNMSLPDLEWFKEQWIEHDASIQETIEIECQQCFEEQEVMIPIDDRFFSRASTKTRQPRE